MKFAVQKDWHIGCTTLLATTAVARSVMPLEPFPHFTIIPSPVGKSIGIADVFNQQILKTLTEKTRQF